MNLREIREQNNNGRSLLLHKKRKCKISSELINQSKNEFESFVKPMMNNLIIRVSNTDNFIKQSNDNVISKSFLERCEEASKLFNR